MVILDATAGNRMMWSNKNPPHTVFMDSEIKLRISPHVFGTWEKLPFRDDAFRCVIFDPPHGFNRAGSGLWDDPKGTSWYGRTIRRARLVSGIYRGAREFFRVSQRLCLKWSDDEISLFKILGLIPRTWMEVRRARVGRKNRAHGNSTWWVTFVKEQT